MNIKKLREMLQDVLDELEYYEDEDKIRMETNTYFLGGAKLFLGISGYNGEYINLTNLDIERSDDDE